MQYVLGAGRVISPALGDESLLSTYSKIRGYHMSIADDAIVNLSYPSQLFTALSMFMKGLVSHAHTMPTQNGTLADYNVNLLVEKIVAAGPDGFALWLGNNMDSEYESFRTAIIDRNLYHYFEFFSLGYADLGEELKKMEAEFSNIDYSAPSRWLSRFFNGIQTSVFEAYVIEMFID